MNMEGEKPQTWVALCLCAIAATVGMATSRMVVHDPNIHEALLWLGLLLSVIGSFLVGGFRFRALNRTLSQIYADVLTGKQPKHTALQRVCILLASVLCVYFMVMMGVR